MTENVTPINDRLEAVSDQIRSGVPVSISDALEVLDYQTALQEQREAARRKSLLGRLWAWIRRP